jgi:biopolymer transport protein ExbB
MFRPKESSQRSIAPIAATFVLVAFMAVFAGASEYSRGARPDERGEQADQGFLSSSFESQTAQASDVLERLTNQARGAVTWFSEWYGRTAPADRVVWGGLTACAALGLFVLLERLAGLRRRKIVPADFTTRFLDRLHDARLDCGQALDHCELNPSPAARIALAAVRRWGRPACDMERAVALSHRVESERLRRNVGTLRRIAALAPLLGLLGTLFALGSALENTSGLPDRGATGAATGAMAAARLANGPQLGHALAAALSPLTAGVVIATLALIAYDGLLIQIEKLAGALDRLGAETIDAIALRASPAAEPLAFAPPPASRQGPLVYGVSSPARTPQPHLRRDGGPETASRLGTHDSGF